MSRNPRKPGRSVIHDWLAGQALSHFRSKWTGRGGRGGLEFRVPGDEGYIADAAAIGSLQGQHYQTYLNAWGFAYRRLNFESVETDGPDNYFTMIFEAKASRSDFKSTFGNSDKHRNRLAPVAHLHFIVANKGVCLPQEVPDFWGLFVRSGRGISLIKYPKYVDRTPEEIDQFAHALLWVKTKGTWSHGSEVPESVRVPNLGPYDY